MNLKMFALMLYIGLFTAILQVKDSDNDRGSLKEIGENPQERKTFLLTSSTVNTDRYKTRERCMFFY